MSFFRQAISGIPPSFGPKKSHTVRAKGTFGSCKKNLSLTEGASQPPIICIIWDVPLTDAWCSGNYSLARREFFDDGLKSFKDGK